MNWLCNSRNRQSGMVVAARSIRMNMRVVAESCITKARRRENLSWLYQAQKLGRKPKFCIETGAVYQELCIEIT